MYLFVCLSLFVSSTFSLNAFVPTKTGQPCRPKAVENWSIILFSETVNLCIILKYNKSFIQDSQNVKTINLYVNLTKMQDLQIVVVSWDHNFFEVTFTIKAWNAKTYNINAVIYFQV